MKLYTEEQVKEAMKRAKWYFAFTEIGHDAILKLIKPIELPSDEEIESATNDAIFESDLDEVIIGFRNGAKWLKEQILNQNK